MRISLSGAGTGDGPRAVAVAGGVAAFIVAGASVRGDIDFEDVAEERGILPYTQMMGMGGGIVAADYDGDGDIDVFVPTALGEPDQLYRNLGDGTFEEIAAAVGVDSVEAHRAALWFDYDGDGDLDLVVTGCDSYSELCEPWVPIHMYRQRDDGIFEDVTVEAGLLLDGLSPNGPHAAGIAAADINNDGYLDLWIATWSGPAFLYLNDQKGSFIDISEASGIGIADSNWQTIFHDFNGDGWQDIYTAIDYTANRLFINQQDNTFIDIAPDVGADNAMNDMGLTLGDYDNDGDFDVYITNIFDALGMGEHNVLLRNDSVGGKVSFTDVAVDLGVDQGYWGWGASFFDCNNDGWLDLAATNGFSKADWTDDPSRFFLSTGGPSPTFTDVSSLVGFDDTDWGSGLIAADFDRDGDLDMMQACNVGGPLRLLNNTPGPAAEANHYLVIKPRMTGPNHFAIGAVVRAAVGDLQLTRLISAGTSFLSQEPAEAFFGVGTVEIVDALTIEWPDGSETTWTSVAADQVLTLVPGGAAGDVNMDGLVGFADLLAVISAWGECAGPPECPEDLDDSGTVDFADLLIVLGTWQGSR